LMPRVLPALVFGLTLSALGEITGYAFGSGNTKHFLAIVRTVFDKKSQLALSCV